MGGFCMCTCVLALACVMFMCSTCVLIARHVPVVTTAALPSWYAVSSLQWQYKQSVCVFRDLLESMPDKSMEQSTVQFYVLLPCQRVHARQEHGTDAGSTTC